MIARHVSAFAPGTGFIVAAAAAAGFHMTPAGIEITVAAIGSAGVMVGGFFQARRRMAQATDIQLSTYAARRLGELDTEVTALRDEMDRARAEMDRLHSDMAAEREDYRHQIVQRDRRIEALETEVAELTRRLDVKERDRN